MFAPARVLPRCAALACLALGAAGGCSSGSEAQEEPASGGQTGEETLACVALSRTSLEPDQTSPLGFSANEVLGALGSSWSGTLTWSDGSSTGLRLTLELTAGPIEHVERAFRNGLPAAEPAASAPGQREPAAGESAQNEPAASEPASVAPGLECRAALEIAVRLGLRTNDGAFEESWPATLVADAASTAYVYRQTDVTALAGSFRVTQVDPAEFHQVFTSVTVHFAGDSWSGTLDGLATNEAGSGPDSDVSAQSFAIATF